MLTADVQQEFDEVFGRSLRRQTQSAAWREDLKEMSFGAQRRGELLENRRRDALQEGFVRFRSGIRTLAALCGGPTRLFDCVFEPPTDFRNFHFEI
jgi:hypothetical protein